MELHDGLNIIFLVLSAMLLIRFLRTGGPKMLKMMDKAMGDHHMQHD